jgi:GntR family transcriptional regulator, transcriptional repressor for pyruvate dehydrogenase complex
VPVTIRRSNLPSVIASNLRGQILRGELKPGSQLPGHRELAAIHSVSVGSVREAISMLISAELIETRPGRGTYVASASSNTVTFSVGPSLRRREVEELTEARLIVEVELAALAAERATPEQIETLRRSVERMDASAADPYDYPEADVDFHLAVAEAAGNRYLLKAMVDIRSLLRQDMELGAEAAIKRFGDLHMSVDSHRRLLEAIEARDSETSRAVAREIVARNQRFVVGLYAMSPESGGGERESGGGEG